MDIPVYHTLMVIGIFTGSFWFFSFWISAFSYVKEEQKIRRILAPINEIALKADELSRMTFSEDKYQQIEEAISSLQPEEPELLSFWGLGSAGNRGRYE